MRRGVRAGRRGVGRPAQGLAPARVGCPCRRHRTGCASSCGAAATFPTGCFSGAGGSSRLGSRWSLPSACRGCLHLPGGESSSKPSASPGYRSSRSAPWSNTSTARSPPSVTCPWTPAPGHWPPWALAPLGTGPWVPAPGCRPLGTGRWVLAAARLFVRTRWSGRSAKGGRIVNVRALSVVGVNAEGHREIVGLGLATAGGWCRWAGSGEGAGSTWPVTFFRDRQGLGGMVAAAIRTIFARRSDPAVRARLNVVAGMFGRQFPGSRPC